MWVRIPSGLPNIRVFMWTISKIVKKGKYLYAVCKEHPKSTKYGYVLMHRVVMENHLGRMLVDGEIVHHKDNNGHNNSIDNLELMDEIDHCRMHSKTGRMFTLVKCGECQKIFKRERRQVKNKVNYCDKNCYWNHIRKIKFVGKNKQ